MDNEQVLQLDPSEILADSNIRFSLKKDRIEKLAEEIMELGGITTPLWVESLPTPVNGHRYRLTAGNYRKAAVEKLNASGAGLTLPCLVKVTPDATSRLKLQLSENKDRENLSPMDEALAIKQLLDAGMPRVEVCRVFSRSGGKKGSKISPLSNSSLNIRLKFLEFPKAIQNKIHSGELGYTSAYELSIKPKEKWDAILQIAEAARLEQVEREEKDEEKYLAAIKKEEEAAAKVLADKAALEVAKASEVTAQAERESAAARAAELFKAAKAKTEDQASKKAAQEALAAAEADIKAADKAIASAKKQAEALEIKVGKSTATLAEKAKAAKAKLKEKAKKAAPTPEDIKKAAKAADATPDGRVVLKAQDMRAVVHELTLPGNFDKVRAIGAAFDECFNSLITTGQLQKKLAAITGEAVVLKGKKVVE